jgi:hypothetical protein
MASSRRREMADVAGLIQIGARAATVAMLGLSMFTKRRWCLLTVPLAYFFFEADVVMGNVREIGKETLAYGKAKLCNQTMRTQLTKQTFVVDRLFDFFVSDHNLAEFRESI